MNFDPTVLMMLGGALAQADAQPRVGGNPGAFNVLGQGLGALPQMLMQYKLTQARVGDIKQQKLLREAEMEELRQKTEARSGLAGMFLGGDTGGDSGALGGGMSGGVPGSQLAAGLVGGGGSAQQGYPQNTPPGILPNGLRGGPQARGGNLDPRMLAQLAKLNPEAAVKALMESKANQMKKNVVVKPGEMIVDPETGQVINRFEPDATAVNPGQSLINPRTGELITKVPQASVSLGKDQRQIDPNTGQVIVDEKTTPIQDYTTKLQKVLTSPNIDEKTRQRALLSLQQMKDSGIAAPMGGTGGGSSGSSGGGTSRGGGGLTIGGRPLTPYDKTFMQEQAQVDVKNAGERANTLNTDLDYIRQSKTLIADYQKALDSGDITGGFVGGRIAPVIESAKSQLGLPNKSQAYGVMEQFGAINQLQTAKTLMKGTGSITQPERVIAKEASISTTDTIEQQKYKLNRIQTLNEAIETAAAAKSKWEEMTSTKDSLGKIVAPGSVARKINGKSFEDYVSEIYRHYLGTSDPAEYLSRKQQ